jgi:hypothetical protein
LSTPSGSAVSLRITDPAYSMNDAIDAVALTGTSFEAPGTASPDEPPPQAASAADRASALNA